MSARGSTDFTQTPRSLRVTRFDEADETADEEATHSRRIPIAKLDLTWDFDRAPKPGAKRSVASLDYLLESEWKADLVLAPLEVRYHHRFVVRLIGFFLWPWDEWAAQMEMEDGLVSVATL